MIICPECKSAMIFYDAVRKYKCIGCGKIMGEKEVASGESFK